MFPDILPVLLSVVDLTSITDFFLIACTWRLDFPLAIAKHVAKRMKEEGFKAYGVEGEQEGRWVLMDYGDVVIHIFYQSVREYYDLEGLWFEAPRVNQDHATA